MSEPDHLLAELVPPDASGSLAGPSDGAFTHQMPRSAKTWTPSVRPKRRLPVLVFGTSLALSMVAGALSAVFALLILAGVANRSLATPVPVPEVSLSEQIPSTLPSKAEPSDEPNRIVEPPPEPAPQRPIRRPGPRPDPILRSR